MKRMKKLAAMLIAVAALVLLPEASTFTVKAAEPVTYAVKYLNGGWYHQANTSTFDESQAYSSLDDLTKKLKDGDVIVIYNDNATMVSLDLGAVRLSNLTFVQNTSSTLVFAGYIEECYVLGGTTGTVNCDVNNAYVYDTVLFNFNNNVQNLYLYANDSIHSNLAVAGTVGHMVAMTLPGHEPVRVHFDYYDFGPNSLHFLDGAFKPYNTDFKTPEEHQNQPASQQTAQNPPASSGSDDEYDEVPKTGQTNLYLWLLGASAVCYVCSLALKRPTAK